MTGGPYRVAAEAKEPPEKIETLRLRRFPLPIQAFLLVWFPAAMIFAAQSTPTATLLCSRTLPGASPTCRVEQKSLVGTERDPVLRVEATEHDGHRRLTVLSEEGKAPLRVDLDQAPEIAREIDAFVASGETGTRSWPLRQGGPFVFIVLSAVELVLVAFLAIAQRRIRIDAHDDRGHVRIEERRLFRRLRVKSLDLRNVRAFAVLDLPEPAKTQAVVATMREKEEQRLFDVLPGEAKKGARFLGAALDRWSLRTATTLTEPAANSSVELDDEPHHDEAGGWGVRA